MTQVLDKEKIKVQYEINDFMDMVKRRNPGQPEFVQAVHEVMQSLIPFVNKHPEYARNDILTRLTEPDRIIIFRVCWEDDNGNIQTNRGYRVQFNNSIGPYKGGLRFHPTVTESVLKFLAFDQVFKNSLTTLPMGGGKGGADFDPKGKSDNEVMRFCQSFMTELSKYIGADVDVPAGDIGVGAREVSYMFGQYKRLRGEFTGTLTGKGLSYGGSLIRTEATGYGNVYFTQYMLDTIGESLESKVCLVSGSGNVAQYTTEKLIELDAKVVTLSDSRGYIYDKDGIDSEKLSYIKELKNVQRTDLSTYPKKYPSATYHAGERPWKVPCFAAFPSATENEINLEDAKTMVSNGCKVVSEGANMPSSKEAMEYFLENKLFYGPSKAANAGGVAISGLEMTQNSMRLSWSREEVDQRLKTIMKDIHDQCLKFGKQGDYVNYADGANIAGFVKVADAMLSYGVM